MKFEGGVSIISVIHKVKHGTRILSQSNCAATSTRFALSVAGLAGVAALVLAIKDGKLGIPSSLTKLPDEDCSLKNVLWVPGLQNLGNNCFLNVILQALAVCSYFRSFLGKVLEDFECMQSEERDECLPLALALTSLLEELCVSRYRQEVLSPRRVMLALTHYIPKFYLTSQQDAEEAFFHILSHLREELSDCYVSNQSSLADVASLSNRRILTPNKGPHHADPERWRESFLGPFDGVLGSNLTCQSCSFQISLDFQFFHSLQLSLVLCGGATILAGCSLEDCLAQYFVAEKLENYWCSHCWHIAAIKYLSIVGENEEDIEKLKLCAVQGSCDCKRISSLGALPWSNRFSCTFKQLSIARSPKILCIHLPRASVNVFGELIKLQGHISFPLILDLSPFMNRRRGLKKWAEYNSTTHSKNQFQQITFNSNHLDGMLETRFRKLFNGQKTNDFSFSEASDVGQAAFDLSVDTSVASSQRRLRFPETMGCSDSSDFCHEVNVGCHRYHLVSVVQHFGRSGSGHYTVFRRGNTMSNDCNSVSPSACTDWFCISDSEVLSVSEEDVLASEASMLFYEKI